MELSMAQYSDEDDPVERAVRRWISSYTRGRELKLTVSSEGLGDDEAARRVMLWIRRQHAPAARLNIHRQRNRLNVEMVSIDGKKVRTTVPAGPVVRYDDRALRFATASWLLSQADDLESYQPVLDCQRELVDELTSAVAVARQTAWALAAHRNKVQDLAPPFIAGTPDAFDDPMDDGYSAESKELLVAQSGALSEAWAFLTLLERNVMIRVLNGVPDEEIAAEFGLGTTTVEEMRTECIGRLRAHILKVDAREE